MHCSLIIPVHNEQKRISKGLKTALSFFKKQLYSWEIIVVNDGSTDQTLKHILPFKKQITLLSSRQNYGKGHAIRKGVSKAKGKYIFFSDIDFSVPISFTNTFLKALTKKDIAIGSRRLSKSKITQHQNSLRESLGHGYTQISNLILDLNHSDLTCGFKAFKNPVAKKLFKLQKINRWAFDSEILYLAKKNNYSVVEIPVTWKNDAATKVNLFTDILHSAISLLRIRL